MTDPTPPFDPIRYKETTRDQWQAAAQAWHAWGPALRRWLRPATEILLDMAEIEPGSRVLDVAAGAGDQTMMIAERVGPTGYVLATDISANILEYAAQDARDAGLTNVETRVMDGENLELESESFDAVISRVGLIYFPNRQKALSEMNRVLKPGGRVGAIVYSTAENNRFFSIPISIIRRRANLPPPLPEQPGPFSLGSLDILGEAFYRAGFTDVQTRKVFAPLRMESAKECVRFERESFGALQQMLSGLHDAEKEAAWEEIERELQKFEVADGFETPAELIVGVGFK
ncbi:MAG TPA: class I SAM-dependent methyltransferase [Chthonomonadaceae bacterium]|nr:class I SAM-dependent methyltransferase [Chthonomonadaceae bacterium]